MRLVAAAFCFLALVASPCFAETPKWTSDSLDSGSVVSTGAAAAGVEIESEVDACDYDNSGNPVNWPANDRAPGCANKRDVDPGNMFGCTRDRIREDEKAKCEAKPENAGKTCTFRIIGKEGKYSITCPPSPAKIKQKNTGVCVCVAQN